MKRILQHVGAKDFKKTHQRKLDEQRVLYLERREKEIQEQQRIEEIKRLSSPFKSDWRSEIDSNKMDEINEGMTTSALLSTILPATGDADLSTTEITSADVFADGPYDKNSSTGLPGTYSALVGASVKSSGSGTGVNGGFNVGSHVAFDGAGVNDGTRWAIFQPVDSTSYDRITFSIIRGTDNNGGEDPDASGEELFLYYKMPGMDDYIPITDYPTLNNFDYYEDGSSYVIIPTGNDVSGVQEYELYIPSYARGKDARFMIYQFNSNDSQGDNYGITKVTFRRRTPLNVFVSLDSPEATNFIRTDPILRGLSAEGRRKKLEDMLDAGDEYLLKQLGMQGSIARPADTFAQRDWTASAYGLPTDYKERLVKANAYLQKNVGSTPISLGLYGGNNVADIHKQSLKTVGFTDRQIDAIEKNNLLQISKTSCVSKKSDSSKTAAPTTSSTSGPYGLPADYKERLIKANAYFQKNVGSIPVSLGLHSGSSNYDRMTELRRKSFKEVGFTDAQIDTIERNNLLQTKFEPSKKMSGVKSSRPNYDPDYSWNRTNVNVDPETFQKLAAQQIAQSRQKQQQVSNNVATSKATSDKSGYADELSKAVAAARAEYLKSGQTVAQRQQSYDKLQAAIKAGTDYATATSTNPNTPPAPPASQPQQKLTPQQLADIDKQIKELEAAAEKSKQDAQNNRWKAAGELAGLAAGAFGIFGAAAKAAKAAQTISQVRKATRAYNTYKALEKIKDAAATKRMTSPGKYTAKPNPNRTPVKGGGMYKDSYEPQGQVISEKKLKSPKEVLNNKIPGYYDGKPAPLGFPDNPPPEMVNGYHPDLVDGKKVADRFNRLDPQSAQAMPLTGNPHIDKKVKAAAKKPK